MNKFNEWLEAKGLNERQGAGAPNFGGAYGGETATPTAPPSTPTTAPPAAPAAPPSRGDIRKHFQKILQMPVEQLQAFTFMLDALMGDDRLIPKLVNKVTMAIPEWAAEEMREKKAPLRRVARRMPKMAPTFGDYPR